MISYAPVNKLKESWQGGLGRQNIGGILGFRALAPRTLTEQVLGLSLRLSFDARVGVPAIESVIQNSERHDEPVTALAERSYSYVAAPHTMPTDP